MWNTYGNLLNSQVFPTESKQAQSVICGTFVITSWIFRYFLNKENIQTEREQMQTVEHEW